MAVSKRWDKNVHQILVGEQVVGFVMRLTSNRWCLSDTEDRRLPGLGTFDTPKAALAVWNGFTPEALEEKLAAAKAPRAGRGVKPPVQEATEEEPQVPEPF